jgi:hypothetical protein
MRVLVVSHGHPAFSIGGAEVASHSLFRGLNAKPETEAFYLAALVLLAGCCLPLVEVFAATRVPKTDHHPWKVGLGAVYVYSCVCTLF